VKPRPHPCDRGRTEHDQTLCYLIVIFDVGRTLKVTDDNGFDEHAPAGNVNAKTPDCFSPLNNPTVTGPVVVMFVGFFGTPTRVSVTVEVALVFQVSFSVPLVFVLPPASNDLQLLAIPNFSVAVSVALVTPPPTQPPSLPFLIVTVGLFFAVLETAGKAGKNVAVPVAVLHTVPTAAPAGEANSPTGSNIAVANKTPANFPLIHSPVVG
jgi:hypothetical protein